MLNWNMKSLSHRLQFVTVLLLISLVIVCSCEDEEQLSDLEVRVTGTLSGVPREGVNVTVYSTEEDAEKEVSSVTLSDDTDSNGKVKFINLELGSSYWIRANTLLLFSIKQTGKLKTGVNEFEITVL